MSHDSWDTVIVWTQVAALCNRLISSLLGTRCVCACAATSWTARRPNAICGPRAESTNWRGSTAVARRTQQSAPSGEEEREGQIQVGWHGCTFAGTDRLEQQGCESRERHSHQRATPTQNDTTLREWPALSRGHVAPPRESKALFSSWVNFRRDRSAETTWLCEQRSPLAPPRDTDRHLAGADCTNRMGHRRTISESEGVVFHVGVRVRLRVRVRVRVCVSVCVCVCA